MHSPSDALAPSVPMATRSQLEGRVREIFNPALNRGTVTTMMKLAATVCTSFGSDREDVGCRFTRERELGTAIS